MKFVEEAARPVRDILRSVDERETSRARRGTGVWAGCASLNGSFCLHAIERCEAALRRVAPQA
jgi:hypothetical protein